MIPYKTYHGNDENSGNKKYLDYSTVRLLSRNIMLQLETNRTDVEMP